MKVAVIGHRQISKSQELVDKLTELFVNLIENEVADTFLFGSRSQFDDLCYNIITELRYKYTHIQRIWVRAEYPYSSLQYLKHVLTYFEDTFYPKEVYGGRAAYVERNQVLVDMCDVLVFYLAPDYKSKTIKSGTKMAVEYAQKKGRRIINILDVNNNAM